MPKAYWVDLRERVVGFVENGRSRRATAAHFKVSIFENATYAAPVEPPSGSARRQAIVVTRRGAG